MLSTLRRLAKRTPLLYLHDLYSMHLKKRSQSNENQLLEQLAEKYVVPRSFVEFGFHPLEFNCAGLADRYKGLLIDGDEHTVKLARRMLPSHVTVMNLWLSLRTLEVIKTFFKDEQIGILSIDVDGNDYWFLQDLLPLRPAIVVTEYNASFLGKCVTVPYDESFDRQKKHQSGWYHGASLSAMVTLCSRHQYTLTAVAAGGANAFFIRNDLLRPDDAGLDWKEAYAENVLRNQWSGTVAHTQWERIKHLPLVDVGGTD